MAKEGRTRGSVAFAAWAPLRQVARRDVIVATCLLFVAALVGIVVWQTLPSSASNASGTEAASRCAMFPPYQQAACQGHALSPPPTTPPPLGAPQLSTWVAYSPRTALPNPPLAFVNAKTGWMVAGLTSIPTVDNHLAAGPTGSVWPGTGVAYTTDGGTSWIQQLAVPTGVWGIDAISPSTAWAVGVTSLYQTTNAGVTWTPLLQNEGGGSNIVNVSFVNVTDGAGLTANGTLEVTTDGGATWSLASTTDGAQTFSALCMQKATVVAATGDGQIWSVDFTVPSRSWVSDYQPAVHTTGVANGSILSCNAGGSAWVTVAPTQTSMNASSEGFVEAQSSPSSPTKGWSTTTASSSTSSARGPHAPEALTGTGTQPMAAPSWVPVSGTGNPVFVASTPGEPQQHIYVQVSSGLYKPASGTGPLFDSSVAASFHGLDFTPDGSGWLLADAVPVPSKPYSPKAIPSSVSEKLVVYHTTDGGTSWSSVFTLRVIAHTAN